MKETRNRSFAIILLLALTFVVPAARVAQSQTPKSQSTVTEASVRKYMTALAGDEMRGRGSATADELRAAQYIAGQLQALKIKPAGDNGDYLQSVKFQRRQRGAPANSPATEATTTNVVGIIPGSDPK